MRSLVFLILAALTACGGPMCPKQLHTDPSTLLAQHAAARPAFNALRAEAKVDQRGKEGRIKGRVMMFLERPDHVRFDAMTQFGPALILTNDGAELSLSDFKNDRFYRGQSCPSNIARVVGVALSAADVVHVLFGEAPALDAAQAKVSCERGCGYQVELARADGLREQLTFTVHEDDLKKPPAEQRTQLSGVVLRRAEGKVLYRVSYADYRNVRGLALPFEVHVIDEAHDADALLRFSEIKLEPNIPAGAFVQTPRRGLTLEALSCE